MIKATHDSITSIIAEVVSESERGLAIAPIMTPLRPTSITAHMIEHATTTTEASRVEKIEGFHL